MFSWHSHKSVPLSELTGRGVFTKIDEKTYRYATPANSRTGVGPITSYWESEPGEVVPVVDSDD